MLHASVPIAAQLAAMTPLPNVPGNALTSNYMVVGNYIFDRHRVDAKVNWNPSSKLTLFARYGFLHYSMSNPPAYGSLGGPVISTAGGNVGQGSGTLHRGRRRHLHYSVPPSSWTPTIVGPGWARRSCRRDLVRTSVWLWGFPVPTALHRTMAAIRCSPLAVSIPSAQRQLTYPTTALIRPASRWST